MPVETHAADGETARTGPPLTTFAYGAANVGNLFRELTDDEAWEILQTAWDVGVRYFDTAPHYGLGLSERRLGAFLATKPRDQFVISTKVGRLLRPNPEGAGSLDTEHDFCVPATLRRVWDFSAAGILTSLEESLERLGLDRVDILYLHDPEKHDLEAAINQALPALVELRQSETVSSIGVGSMSTDALLACAKQSNLDVLMIAGRYTLAEQPAAAEVLPVCHEKGIGVVAASVFNSGLLSTEIPLASGRYEYGSVPTELWERILAITDVCSSFDVPLPAAALQYPLRDQAVHSVVVGGSRPAHLRQNAQYMDAEIPEELWAALSDRGLIPA